MFNCSNNNIIILIFVLIFCFIYCIHKINNIERKLNNKVENFTTQDDINTAVKKIYLADVEAIRLLSNFAIQLSQGGFTVPGNLNITGNLNNNGNITCTNNINGETINGGDINGETINGGDINSTRSFINGGYLTFTNYNNLVNKVQLFGTGTDMGMVNNKYNAASGGSWSTDWGNEIRFDLTKSKCNLRALQFSDCPQNITSSSDQIYINNTPTSSVHPSQTNLQIHTNGSLSVRSNLILRGGDDTNKWLFSPQSGGSYMSLCSTKTNGEWDWANQIKFQNDGTITCKKINLS